MAPNVISGNDANGVTISGTATATLVEGNRIGTNLAGSAAVGNTFQGVEISVASGNFVGNASFPMPPPRNLISGNGAHGVRINNGATNNRVQGNYIGTDLAGNVALGNAFNGAIIESSSNNSIGGECPGRGEHPLRGTGPEVSGLDLGRSPTTESGETAIGLSSSQAPLPNLFAGVGIDGGAVNSFIGNEFSAGARTSSPAMPERCVPDRRERHDQPDARQHDRDDALRSCGGQRASWGSCGRRRRAETDIGTFSVNTIAYNLRDGVFVDRERPTRSSTGPSTTSASAWISLRTASPPTTRRFGTRAPTTCRISRSLSRPPLPVSRRSCKATLSSAPNTLYKVDFYWSTAWTPRGGGRENFLETADITTDGSGNASFTVTLNQASPPGSVITATATPPPGTPPKILELRLGASPLLHRYPLPRRGHPRPRGPYGGPSLSGGVERSFLMWNRCGSSRDGARRFYQRDRHAAQDARDI